MKKTIYISGIITANLLLIGCIFKVNHWPGAGIVLTLSLLVLSFWFLPVALINHYKGQKGKNKKWLYIAAFLTFFITFLAALFKVQHWPGASTLLLIGVPIPFLLFLPVYIYHSIKDKEQSPVNFTAIILGLIFVAIYSGLLNIDVSKEVLDHGVHLIKSNENLSDYYEENLEYLSQNNLTVNKNLDKIKYVKEKSDRIYSLINDAKKVLLEDSENYHLTTDLGEKEFNSGNMHNYDSRNSAQYLLVWKENAIIPKLQNELISLEKYLNTLNLSPELKSSQQTILNLGDNLDYQKKSWMEIEFTNDYMVYALEALSRWEKNIRFVEYIAVSELIKDSY